jgi:hypothetical protein
MLIVGNDGEKSYRKKPPQISFILHINGTKRVLDYLRNIPNEPKDLPTDSFNVIMKISCPEAESKWGFQSQHEFQINERGTTGD